jgi:hypothetical protein
MYSRALEQSYGTFSGQNLKIASDLYSNLRYSGNIGLGVGVRVRNGLSWRFCSVEMYSRALESEFYCTFSARNLKIACILYSNLRYTGIPDSVWVSALETGYRGDSAPQITYSRALEQSYGTFLGPEP